MIEKPEKVSLSQIVCDRIKSYIIEHELKVGDRLPSEKQLIEWLGVSRTVVREALKALEMVGFLKIRTGDGIYVDTVSLKPVLDQVKFRWTQDDRKMKELLETRRVLELGAIELAIERYDLAMIEQMDRCNRRMADAVKGGKLPLEEDLEFHRALFRATGNETFMELSDVLSEFFASARRQYFGESKDLQKSLDEHDRIVRAIKEKQLEEAKRQMEIHLVALKRFAVQ